MEPDPGDEQPGEAGQAGQAEPAAVSEDASESLNSESMSEDEEDISEEDDEDEDEDWTGNRAAWNRALAALAIVWPFQTATWINAPVIKQSVDGLPALAPVVLALPQHV